jgi:hypothetical protein
MPRGPRLATRTPLLKVQLHDAVHRPPTLVALTLGGHPFCCTLQASCGRVRMCAWWWESTGAGRGGAGWGSGAITSNNTYASGVSVHCKTRAARARWPLPPHTHAPPPPHPPNPHPNTHQDARREHTLLSWAHPYKWGTGPGRTASGARSCRHRLPLAPPPPAAPPPPPPRPRPHALFHGRLHHSRSSTRLGMQVPACHAINEQ